MNGTPMQRRRFLSLPALGAVPAALGLSSTAWAQAKDQIQLGCPVPMSGPFAANGKFADLGMRLAVEQYGKVLGLVTMDDLLALIFGVIRDERAALQASSSNLKAPRTRTPPGVPVATAQVESGPVMKEPALDTGPVTKEEVLQRADGNGSEALDPPVRPMFAEEEVTPPAVDVEDIRPPQEKSS